MGREPDFSFSDLLSIGDLDDAIMEDDRNEFIDILERERESFRPFAQAILDEVCNSGSVKCAEALIKGETCLPVDVNLPSCPYTGVVPLHGVVLSDPQPSIIELLLYYGARTDIRLNLERHDRFEFEYGFEKDEEKLEQCINMLPLEIALHGILPEYYQDGWTPKDSIYKLITILCLPRLQNHLEAIALLAGTTKETGEIMLEYAMAGKIVELACLLVAAPKEKLHDVMDRVRQHFDPVGNTALLVVEDQSVKLVCLRQLLELFDKAGDRISAYVKENKLNVCQNKTTRDVKELLRSTGFHFMDSEVHLSEDPRYRYTAYVFGESGECLPRCLNDFGMAHYSTSGYRWKVSSKDPWLKLQSHEAYINELENEVKCLKKNILQIEKKQQQLNLQIWMDDELWCALKKDDREEFISVIANKECLFSSRKQQILYAVCCSGSIKCAESLIKGQTPLTVDLNAPCTDTGLYPLHCAALSLFPSITELLIYHGAQTDIQFTRRNPWDSFPQHLVELHTNKLPLHMALHGISCLLCIREWTFRHPIHKLVALLCLPRVQKGLETLGVLAVTTKETEKEFLQFAMDGKFVELTALLMVAPRKLYGVMIEAEYKFWNRDLIDDGEREIKKTGLELCRLFHELRDDIAAYVQEDKSNVSKYQVVEDLTSMIKANGLLDDVDLDLSVYNWYRNEESSYPSKAPYECVSRSPSDVGMEHYSKSSFRWRGSKRKFAWRFRNRRDCKRKLLSELQWLQSVYGKEQKWLQKKMKPATMDCPYIIRQGVPIASSRSFSLNVDASNKMHGGGSYGVRKLWSTRAMSSLASSHNNLQNTVVAMTSPFRIPSSPSSRSRSGRRIRLVASCMKAIIQRFMIS